MQGKVDTKVAPRNTRVSPRNTKVAPRNTRVSPGNLDGLVSLVAVVRRVSFKVAGVSL